MREIRPITYQVETVSIPATDSISVLLQAVNRPGTRYALAHCDDGVVWGRFDSANGKWAWSTGRVPNTPPLRVQTLQQLRLFGELVEVFVWRDSDGLRGRAILDGRGTAGNHFDEAYLLWGQPEDRSSDFQVMREGAQGFLHAPPAEIARDGRLMVRNYIQFDDDGCAKIVGSRLVG